ncbi:MAG: glycoside hydrolase family 3 N-terminal domain-containing protein [Erythrobacter sp.]
MRAATLLATLSLVLTGCASAYGPAQIPAQPSAQPLASAPEQAQTVDLKAEENSVVASLLARMSVERKVGQLIQPQINSFTAEDMERYRFGSYLNGGNGGPYGDEFAPASEWLKLADEMYDASVKPLANGEPAIPVMWGTDAVHGHSNIVGATLFPHNIALGAAGDADLVRRIGAATATEIEVTGIDWNFSPTVAVARDDRWGRTYESYSENPDLVAKLGAALVEGQQGIRGEANYLGDGKVIATAKHFFGDGGTARGVDQGEVNGDIDALIALHGRPYPAAIKAGVETIMASFNSINGRKMHGNKDLLTDVLRGDMGFDGLVVGDWNGHGQIKGCEVTDCPQSLMAGLDIYMVPDEWKPLMESLIAQIEDGTIPMARLDEAVTRILRVKYRAGLLGPDAKRPSERGVAGRYELLASAQHRALAREAVARSQVVLKNDGVLPLAAGANVLVTGDAANHIGIASGGWTLEWQGMTESNATLFPKASTIWSGIREGVEANGGTATLSKDGLFETKPDVAVVVFGERPYAEFVGDQSDLVFRDEAGLKLLREFKAQGIPAVAVFLSGRPMWMNRELNASNAFVAAWLPGSEGAGVGDVLTGRVAASGKLSFSWPAACEGEPLNGPDGALFALGYGRSLQDIGVMPELSEECGPLSAVDLSELFVAGRLGAGVSALAINAEGNFAKLDQLRGSANGVSAIGVDRNAQEDAREVTIEAGSTLTLTSEIDSTAAFRIVYQLVGRPTAPVTLQVGTAADGPRSSVDITQALAIADGKGWREMVITSACAAGGGSALSVKPQQELTIQIASVTREELPQGTACAL